MSKKHFIALAKALREHDASPSMIAAIADVCAATNEHFDRPRFVTAASPR